MRLEVGCKHRLFMKRLATPESRVAFVRRSHPCVCLLPLGNPMCLNGPTDTPHLKITYPFRFFGFISELCARLLRRTAQRKVVCFAVAFNLLLWSGPGMVAHDLIAIASRVTSE